MDPHSLARMRRLRWIGYGLLAFVFMLAFFHRMAPAVLASDLQQAFNASGASLGMLAAAYFLAYTAMQIPSGVLADTLGARRVVAVGSVLAGFGALAFALSESLTGAMLGRLLVGLGVSVTFIATLKFGSQWFHDRQFATVTGLTILLGNIGALSATTPLSWAVTQTGWRQVFFGLAGVSLVVAAAVFVLVRNRPEDARLPSMRALEGLPAHAPHQGDWRPGLWRVLRNPRTWPGFWASAGQGGMFYAFAGLWAFPFLRDVYRMDAVSAANHISCLVLGYAAGAMLLGNLSDRLGLRRPVMLVSMVICLLCWVPLMLAVGLPGGLGYGLFLLLGISSAGYTLTLATTKEVNPPALSGMSTGVANMGTFFGALILQPLVGWVMDLAWDGTLAQDVRIYSLGAYQLGLGLLVGSTLLALVFALRVEETYGRYRVDEAVG